LYHQILVRTLYRNKNPIEEKFKDADFSISEEVIAKHLEVLFRIYEDLRLTTRDILFCKDLISSLKALGAIYIFARISSMFSGITLLWIGFIIAFAFPPIYQKKKSEIDGIIQKGLIIFHDSFAKLVEKAPVVNTVLDKFKTS